MTALVAVWQICSPMNLHADTLYKTDSGALTFLDTINTTPTAPGAIIQNYAEGTGAGVADIITFNNLITAATTFRVSATAGANLSIAGLSVLNPSGTITLSNTDTLTQTLTLGASGIDMSAATQNLTLANGATGTMTVVTGAAQTWTMRTGRILSLAAVPVTLSNNVIITGAGTVNIGNATVGNAISGAGTLTINGAQSGGASVVTLSGNNSAWTGAVTVGGGAQLNIDQLAAGQNKLADAQTLTLNRGALNMQGASGGTETVAALSLGQGLNAVLRSAGTGVLQANAITRSSVGSALNVGNIGTVAASSYLTTDNLNTNLILGTWVVAINGVTDTNWVKNATGAPDGAVIAASGADYTTNNALDTWTTATQNILMTTTGTASTASRTINSLKIAHGTPATAVTADIGAGNTLTINDGFNGGGIIRNQNGASTIGNATVGVGSLTAGGVDDSVNDTLYIWNSQNTMTINNVIKDNNTGAGTDTLHLFSGGAGTVTVTADNTFTGGTTIAAGTLAIGNNAAAADNADLGTGDIVNHGTLILSKTVGATLAQMTIANNITGIGAFTINRGTATLSGVNTYSGATNVSASTTLLAGSATGISANSRMLLNAATAILDLNGFDSSVAALRGDQTTAGVTLGANTLTLSGSLLANSSSAETLTFVPQVYQGVIIGTGNLIKNGTYTQTFTAGGALSYTGATTVNNGTLQFDKASTTTGLTINGTGIFIANAASVTAATAAVNLAGTGSTFQVNNGFNQSFGSLTGVANSRLTLARGAAATNITVTDIGGVPVTFAGVIQETGTGVNGGSFTKAGANTLILTGGNAYTGATTINDGVIQIGAANSVQVISDRSTVILADVLGANLDLNGNSETIGSLAGGGATGGNVLLGAGTLTMGLDGTTTSYGGGISGAGGLVKVGTGTQTLSGVNTFTGVVTIGNLGGQTGGGLTLSGGSALADTVAVSNRGYNTVLTVNTSETTGAVTGTQNSTLVLGAGATLTSSYTNGAPTALPATADSASANGRIVRNINTATLKVGDLISGTGVTVPSYIVQILDNDSVLVNQLPPVGPSTDFIPTVTSVNVLGSAMSGTGGFTKDGTGLLILTGNNTQTGTTTISNGDVQVGGIWTGQKFSLHDTLSNSSQIAFSAVNATNLNFANSSTNLLSFERVGSLSGGAGITTSINLLAGGNIAALAIGSDDSTSTFTGRFLGDNGGTWLIKEGAGTFTWSNATANVFDGTVFIDKGGFTITGATGFDAANFVRMTNGGTALNVQTTGGDTISFLEGGAGSSRILPNGAVGGLYGSYLTSGVQTIALTTSLTVNQGTAANIYTYNGDITGAGTLIKSGAHQFVLTGTSSNAFTGETQITAGTLRMGVIGAATGVGTPAINGQAGTLSTATGLRLTGGILDINGTTQSVLGINATSTGGTIALVNGTLNLTAQTTQTTGTVLTGNLNSVLNLTGSAVGQTLTLTGNNTGFGGTINVGSNIALTLNRAGGALNSTGLFAARVNLNGTGTQLTVTLADTIGSLAGAGNATLTQGLTLSEARSGTVSATGYSGVMSGVGGLTLSNYGGLALSGNNTNTGATTLSSNSTLILNYGAGSDILESTTGVLTLNGGTVRVISSAGAPTILESVASTNLNAGASSMESFVNFTADSAANQTVGQAGINLGIITRVEGGTLNIGTAAAATTSTNSNGILADAGAEAWATFNGSTWAVGDGAGTAAITGLAAGGYTINGYAAGNHTDATVTGAGGTTETVRFNTAAAVDVNTATTLNMGGILVTANVGANASTISGTLNSSLFNQELIIHQYNTRGDLILSDIQNTDTVITTAGGGRTIITNDVDGGAGSGGTNIGYGYLHLGSTAAGGSAAGMVGSNGVTGIVNNGTLGINRSNAVSISSVISGTGNFEQLGSGTTTLSSINTFQGRVTVKSGTLSITTTAGLGAGAATATNRWANLTSVNSGGTLDINVAVGGTDAATQIAAGTITEVLNLDGGTLNLRNSLAAGPFTNVATTLAAPIILSSSSTITVSNLGPAVNHIISGEIFAMPGSNLTIGGVVNATPSTLVLAPTSTTGSRWENTTINANARLQIGNNTRGWLGTGSVVNNGTLITNTNNGHLVLGNQISGSGNFIQARNTVYLTGDNSAYTGTWTVGSVAIANAGAELRVGNDTYTGSLGTGDVTLQATAGSSLLRTHLIADNTLANNITLNAATTLNAHFLRQGFGSITLTGNLIIGANSASTGRAILQTEAGGKLFWNGTLVGGSATNLLNIVNNGEFIFGGSASNTYNGVISGGGRLIFDNTGTTTLLGINTVNTNINYIRKGTVVIGTGGVNTWHDDGDLHVLNGATLSVVGNETIGSLIMQRGATTSIAVGTTLTVDDALTQLVAGSITGAGNLTLAGGTYMAMYGTNTATGLLNVSNATLQLGNMTNAIGSFSTVTLGAGTTGGKLEYVGSGETYAGNITLAGTNVTATAAGSNRITANGNGALILSGNITATGTSLLQLTGQTGGYFNPIKNQITGAITEGAGVLSLAMPNVGNDDRYGISGRWALTNAANDFSGAVTVNVGMLELNGDLKTGIETTSVLGDLFVARTITLGSDNFDGRRYDMFGNGDQVGAGGFGQGTNLLAPNTANVGTIIFNDPNAGTATFGSNISWTGISITAANTTGMQLINDGTKTIVISGTLSSGASGFHNWILDGTNATTNTINGVISNPTTQTTAVIKEGAGTWRLGGANTYTGTTIVNNGILELAGGLAIADANTVSLNGDGGDGLFSGTAKLRIINSETFAILTGDILTEAEILAGQTLSLTGGNGTMNGLITGAGNLTKTVGAAAAGTLSTTAKNTYTGITTLGATGAATVSAGISVWHLADGGLASGLGASGNAAGNLVFVSNAAANQGGTLTWNGLTNQSTDRLFTMGLGTLAARIDASGTVVGTLTAPTINFSNTGAIAYTGAGARTLTLGGTTISDNQFNPLIADSGGATNLIKTGAGLWLVKNGGNSFTGGTRIDAGTLAIDNGTALGGALININGGNTVGFQLRGGITVANAITNTVAAGGIQTLTGVNVASGLTTLTGDIRVVNNAGSSLEFNNGASSLTGAGGIFKMGAGTLILSGVNSQTGVSQVSGGTLQLVYGVNNTSKLADAVALTLGWSGNGFLNGPGSDDTVASQANGVGLTGGTIDLSGGSHVEVVSATTLAAGASYITRSSGTSTLRMNAITRTAGGITGGTIDFGIAGIADTDTTNTNGILGTSATGAYATVAKTDWAINFTGAADGAITALAAAGYNNGLAIETFGAGFNTDIISAAATTGAATTNTLRFNATQATTLTLTGTLSLQASGILVTPTVGAFNTIITGSAIQNAAVTAALDTLIIHQHNTLGALQIDSIIQNNTGAQGITKVGAGKLFLGGLNQFTGAINLHEGEIQVGGTAAIPGTATNAFLSGLAVTPGANASAAWNLSQGTTLRFLTTNTTVYNTPLTQGHGDVILDTGNLGVVLFDDANVNWLGNLTISGGTVQLNNATGLGDARGITTINGGGTLQINGSVNSGELITYTDGATVTTLAAAAATLSGRQTLNNTSAAGLTFNIPTNTTITTVGLNISGLMYGANGFTKTGTGILQISANNFADVYDGYTGINKTPTLSGQIMVNQGILYVGGTRALGAFGAGNETVVAAGATVDLRDQDLNLGDDSDLSREIFKIQGTGVNGTGALRNTAGTAQLSFLTLDGNATINSGGFANSTALILGTYDTNLSNANGLTGAFTRNRPVIAGGGFDLTVIGARNSTDNMIFADPTFSTALNSLIIRGSSVRFRHEVSAALADLGVTSTDITNGIEIGYGGQILTDATNSALGLGANTGARLLFENQFNTHNTVNITMNGVIAAANNGANYLQVDFFTIPDGTTFLDGSIALTGTADRNFIISDSVGNYTVAEQGNTTVAPATKLVIGGQITGTGGFTKMGQSEVRLTNDNTFTGDLNVLRLGSSAAPWESHTYKINGVDYATQGLAEGWAEYSLTLNGTGAGDTGKLSGVSNINLQRRGMITLDNTTRLDATSGVVGGNDNNRINDAAITNFNNGWLRINGGTVNNTEALGTVNVQSGTNIVDLYPTDGAGTNMTLTIGTLNRTAGSTIRFTNLDATATFSTAAVGESVRVAVGTLGATEVGNNTIATDKKIVLGVLGGTIPLGLDTDFRILGFNNGNVSDLWNQQRNLQFFAGSHFMTYDAGFLRPLDDSEYFTATGGLLSNSVAGGLNQNVDINDGETVMKENTTINALRFGPLADNNGSGGTLNASTGLTSYTDHNSTFLRVDGTLTIASGMISSATFTVGNSNDAAAYIIGGNLDFGTREAIINVQNGFYRTTDALIAGGNLEIRSNIMGSGGLTKTGFQTLVLDGANTYSGVTTIHDGVLFLRNGRTAAGVGGAGNGIVITGNGNLNSGNGIQVGTAAAREDIYVGALIGDLQIMRVDNDVTNWFSNVTIDNVDVAGQVIFTPRIRTDNSATSIINGNIVGGNTAVSEDVLAVDPRRVSFNSAGNNVFIIRGQIGDKDDGSGNAVAVGGIVSTMPTGGGFTNENNVLRVDLGGASLETNYHMERQYNAAGRLTLESGNLLVDYDPTVGDGTGFWTNTAISRIANADSTTTTFAVNGGTVFQGFQLGAVAGTGVNNGNTGLFLTRANQVFNMASWSTIGTGAKYIGGLNETGTVTYGNGTGSLSITGAVANLQAADGGTVVFNQRMIGDIGTATNVIFGFVKQGRGTVELRNSTVGAGNSNFVLAGGTLLLNHTAAASVALVGSNNVRFDGGTLISVASSGANTTEAFATAAAANRVLDFTLGGNEIVARTVNTGVARNMTINMGNADANATTSNFTRALSATANFVEDQTAGGTAQITLNFNASSTAAVKNQVIAWATYGTLSRTATDFAMVDVAAANDVRAFGRAADEFNNNVATWAAGQDVSENGGAGFSGTLGGALSVSTIRFDANADSVLNLGTNVLTVAGTGLASSGGGILLSSNVGAANKTITGTGAAALTTSGGTTELIIHHYGTGNLNINVPITGAGVDLTITGPSTTNASTIGTTGAVVLGATNTYTGRTFVNGAVLSFNDAAQLGTNPGAGTANQITMNGGTLRYTGTGLSSLGNRGITFGGNGGTIDVAVGGAELYIADNIASTATFRGDMIKVGAGTLTLEGNGAANAGFLGLIDVRQGTLRLAGDVGNAATGTSTLLGSNSSYADGTIFRSGTNLAIQMGNGNDSGDWTFEEWLTFEGNNYISVGTINTQTANVSTSGFVNPNNERPVNFAGVITLQGTTTFDVVQSQTFRVGWNGSGAGYLTGNGDLIKDGQGTMEIRTNNPDFTGNITIAQGRLYVFGQADPLGTGYLTGKTITLGSADRQGIAELAPHSESGVQNQTIEVNHDINVVYNPAQTKRILFETFGNGSRIDMNGDITLNDNLNVYINDGAETGGSQNYVNFNGQLKDGVITSGNIVFSSDDTGGANDNTSGRTYNYLVLKADNSLWTGDVRISAHTAYDQDETAILRLEHNNALTAANDVDMGFNSMLQVGGGARTIGSLSTNGGVGPFIGDTAGGTMGASTNGSSEIIENAASTAGTLTITQTTPVSTEVQWDAYFRDGTLNSQFFAPGIYPVAAAALNVVKAGNGWATLTMDNAYTGNTTVTAGTLQVGRQGVGDTGAITAAGFTSNAGTTVSGTGIIQGATVINGQLRPGDEAGGSMGTLTINGNTTLGAASVTTLQIQRSSYTAMNAIGTNDTGYGAWIAGVTTDTIYSHLLDDPVTTAQHDQLRITGSLTVTAGSQFVLENNGYNPTAGDVFNLMDWVGVMTGSFNVGSNIRTGAEAGLDLDLFELGSNFRWDVSQFNTAGIAVVVIATVPEPSRMLLLMFGLMALFFRRRRR